LKIRGKLLKPPAPEMRTGVSKKWSAPYTEIEIGDQRYQTFQGLILPCNEVLWRKDLNTKMNKAMQRNPLKKAEIAKQARVFMNARLHWIKNEKLKRSIIYREALRNCRMMNAYEEEERRHIDPDIGVEPDPLWMD
jgi:hypothetical protein